MAKKKLETRDLKISLTYDISLDALVSELGKLDQDDMFLLIKELDLTQEDYGFTEKLAKYFIHELRKEHDSASEPFDINELYEGVKKEYKL